MDDSRRRKRVFKTAAVNPAAGPRWTKTEDALLESSVNELGEDFPSIAERFNGTRTEAQCQHRWSKVLQPGFVKGPWQPEEDEVILAAVEQLDADEEPDWQAIADEIPGRIAKQVRERWNNHLNPTLKTGPFTPDEDLLLEQAVSDLGTHWIEVARRVPGRSENACKNRWNSSARKRAARSRPRQHAARPIAVNGSGGGAAEGGDGHAAGQDDAAASSLAPAFSIGQKRGRPRKRRPRRDDDDDEWSSDESWRMPSHAYTSSGFAPDQEHTSAAATATAAAAAPPSPGAVNRRAGLRESTQRRAAMSMTEFGDVYDDEEEDEERRNSSDSEYVPYREEVEGGPSSNSMLRRGGQLGLASRPRGGFLSSSARAPPPSLLNSARKGKLQAPSPRRHQSTSATSPRVNAAEWRSPASSAGMGAASTLAEVVKDAINAASPRAGTLSGAYEGTSDSPASSRRPTVQLPSSASSHSRGGSQLASTLSLTGGVYSYADAGPDVTTYNGANGGASSSADLDDTWSQGEGGPSEEFMSVPSSVADGGLGRKVRRRHAAPNHDAAQNAVAALALVALGSDTAEELTMQMQPLSFADKQQQ